MMELRDFADFSESGRISIRLFRTHGRIREQMQSDRSVRLQTNAFGSAVATVPSGTASSSEYREERKRPETRARENTKRKEKMKDKIKTGTLPGQTKLRRVTQADLDWEKKWNAIVKKGGGFKYDDDVEKVGTGVASPDIEKAESMPEWIGGGVYDPRWDDVYLDLDPENPTPEPQPTAAERAERRAIEEKALQDACDYLNKFYRLGKYASHR